MDLPEGFVLDDTISQAPASLPEGFVLDAPAQPGFLEENIGRPLARAGKNVVTGLTQLAEAPAQIGGALNNAISQGIDAITGIDTSKVRDAYRSVPTATQTIASGIDNATGGITVPRNATERVVDDASRFLVQNMVPGLGAAKTGSELLSAATAGLGAGTAQEVAPGNPYAEIAGAVVGGGIPGLVAQGVPAGARAIMGAKPQVVDEFAATGIDPNLAAVGGRGSKMVLNALKETPFAGKIVEDSMQKTLDQIKGKVTGIADTLSTAATPAEAGKVALSGAKNFVDRFKGRSNELYNKVSEYLPKDTPVPVTNSIEFLQKQADELAGTPTIAKELENPKLARIFEGLKADAKNGTLPYNAISGLRSQIGKMIATPSIISDIPTGQLKRLYGALSADMRKAAETTSPNALKAFDRANDYYSSGIARIEGALDNVLKQTDPEKAFRQLSSGTRQGAQQFATLKKSLAPEERDALQSVMIRQMGKANPSAQDATSDVFSANTFLTNYNRLSDESKKLLLNGSGHDGLRESLDRLLQVASRTKDVDRLSNPSGTGRTVFTNALLGASIVALPKIAALIPTGVVAAKLMTSPKFVNWLAKTSTVNTKEQMATHISKLAAIASATPQIALDIENYIKTLNGQEEQ